MERIIGVQFQKNGKVYYFDANNFEPRVGEYVIVDTARGLDLGEVIIGVREVNTESWRSPLKKTIRIATPQDIQHSVDNRLKEKEAFSVCQRKIAEHGLEMKLISVEYAFDNSKILFFFTANGRVDFRSLVKDLASIFKMRIELRQIGVRDEAKMLGGLGPCGRQICCGAFLEQFQPVSIKMAKEQNLSLNPTKISGVCGRLMCCLKYEQDHYEQTRKKMPKVGREVMTPDGAGPVTELNIVKETVSVRLTNGDSSEIKEYPLENITRITDASRPSVSPESRPKPGRRNGGNHPEESSSEDSSGSSAQAAEEARPREEKAAESREQPAEPKKTDKAAPPRQRRNRPGKGALGQPVRRENPNRSSSPAAANGNSVPASSAENSQQKTKAPAQAAKSSGPWADALQKAMDAIENQK